MPGIITYKFRLNNAKQVYESFVDDANDLDRYYTFLARSIPWSDDTAPPTPVDCVSNTDYRVWDNMIATKRITQADIRHSVPRYSWTTGTVYQNYRDDIYLYDKQFYVVTDNYDVYKCIDNNGGATSTVKPTSAATTVFTTADGYTWKYMYTINAADVLKFVTTDYLPVKTLTADDSSSQWTVQQAAVNGAIEFVSVSNGGSDYLQASGTLVSVTDNENVTLASDASGTDDVYVGSTIYITGGVGAGQLRDVVNYVGATKAVRVSPAFVTTPDGTSTYFVGPKVTISGVDGSGATAYANVTLPARSDLAVGNSINKIIVLTRGSDYNKPSVTVTANTSHGTGATAFAYHTPFGGHGSNAIDELGGFNLVLNVRMEGNESNVFITGNDFRTVGIIKNPKLDTTGLEANSTVYDLTTKLTVSSKSGSFSPDEVIRGLTSSANAYFVSFANTNATGTKGVISVTGLDGTFTASETIQGDTSAVTAAIDVSGINNRDLADFEGDALYIENRYPVSRATDQTEDIKLVIRY